MFTLQMFPQDWDYHQTSTHPWSFLGFWNYFSYVSSFTNFTHCCNIIIFLIFSKKRSPIMIYCKNLFIFQTTIIIFELIFKILHLSHLGFLYCKADVIEISKVQIIIFITIWSISTSTPKIRNISQRSNKSSGWY